MLPMKSRRQKSQEAANSTISSFPFDDLNQDLLEKVLSRLPPSSFFLLRSVCKKWNAVASSSTFRLACSEVQSREPWFLMVGQNLNQSIIFDISKGSWKNLNHPNFRQQIQFSKSMPVASSGGLVCFRSPIGHYIVCNLLNNAYREVPPLSQACESKTLHAIAMSSSTKHNQSTYKIVLVIGELPNLSVKIFDSEKNEWKDELLLRKTNVNSTESNEIGGDEPETVYFLSKTGEVVATNMQRSPSKQYSSILTIEDGEERVYFLSQTGNVVACNLSKKSFSEYPRLLPIYFEYSIDVVECNGEMLVVGLSDLLETASLRIWKFLKGETLWKQVAAMPPSMSHEFFAKKADINCVGCGDSILICLNSSESFSSYVTCNLDGNEWIELPKCFVNGRDEEFMSAFSFEPRVEISA